MKTFTKISRSSKLKCRKTGDVVEVYKYVKDGTKRVFFTPELNGKRLSKTMYARLGSCERDVFNWFRTREVNA